MTLSSNGAGTQHKGDGSPTQSQGKWRLVRLANEYLAALERDGQKKPKIIKDYRCQLKGAVAHLGPKKLPGNITPKDINCLNKNRLTALRAMFQWAVEEGILDNNPVDEFRGKHRKIPKPKPPLKRLPSDVEGSLGYYVAAFVKSRKLCAIYSDNLQRVAYEFVQWLGEHPQVADITETQVSDWLESLESRLCDRSIIGHRRTIISILRFAADDEARPEPRVRRIRKYRLPRPLPRAWTAAELERLIEVCHKLTGTFKRRANGKWESMTERLYFVALVRVAFESGLRRGSIWNLHRDEVLDDGTIYLKHAKTDQPHVGQLAPTTVELFRSLPGDRPLLWNSGSEYLFYARWKAICKAADIDHGAMQRVRKTGATQVFLGDPENPSRVQRFLGHRNSDMWQHYVDQSQSTVRPPRPSLSTASDVLAQQLARSSSTDEGGRKHA